MADALAEFFPLLHIPQMNREITAIGDGKDSSIGRPRGPAWHFQWTEDAKLLARVFFFNANLLFRRNRREKIAARHGKASGAARSKCRQRVFLGGSGLTFPIPFVVFHLPAILDTEAPKFA